MAIIALAFDVGVAEGGGVKALDDREGFVLTCFVAAAELFVLVGAGVVGEGILEITVTGVSDSEVLLACSVVTDSAVCIALGYKSPIAVWIFSGYESLETVVGAAVIIVANKHAEITGIRRRDHFMFFMFFIFLILSVINFKGQKYSTLFRMTTKLIL